MPKRYIDIINIGYCSGLHCYVQMGAKSYWSTRDRFQHCCNSQCIERALYDFSNIEAFRIVRALYGTSKIAVCDLYSAGKQNEKKRFFNYNLPCSILFLEVI
jgi:hypothetical protein